jgi:hypothetical protein
MPDRKSEPARKSEPKTDDDAFKPEGRPTAREVAEQAAKDEVVHQGPDPEGSK